MRSHRCEPMKPAPPVMTTTCSRSAKLCRWRVSMVFVTPSSSHAFGQSMLRLGLDDGGVIALQIARALRGTVMREKFAARGFADRAAARLRQLLQDRGDFVRALRDQDLAPGRK